MPVRVMITPVPTGAANRTLTASTEVILRRITRKRHPSHVRGDAAGRLRAEDRLRGPPPTAARPSVGEREGLNVMESSGGANSVLVYGQGGEIPRTG